MAFIDTMRKYPMLHNPVFVTLSPPLDLNSPRRMAPLGPLRDSIFVTCCRKLVDSVADQFRPLGYRVIQPSILFNLGESPAQEPHMDGEVLSETHPTLSVLINPLHCAQAVWIAKNSHHPGNCYMEKINIPSMHAVVLRHDVCHAGFACQKHITTARVHLNLVHRTDTRGPHFTFDEYVIPCIRGPFGSRFKLTQDGDFDHVVHHVNRDDDEDGQGDVNLNDEDAVVAEGPNVNDRKRKAMNILAPMLEQAREKVAHLETRSADVEARARAVAARVAEARRVLEEVEQSERALDEEQRAVTRELDEASAVVDSFEILFSG